MCAHIWRNKKIANKILTLSDRKIVAISFRFALIMALIVIVALNYYSTIFKMEESTTVLEFIASTILIPVLFEWISSIKIMRLRSIITVRINKDLTLMITKMLYIFEPGEWRSYGIYRLLIK